MSLYRLLLRSLRRCSTPLPVISQSRSFAFSSAEEAAAERRRRKRRLRIEPPLNAIRPPPQHNPTRDPNAPRLPDSTSALVGPRLSLHNRVQSLIRAGDLDAASATARHSVFSITRPTVFTCNAIIAAMYRSKRYNEAIALFHFFFNQSNIVPNIVSYNNLINTHCDEGRVDVALEVYRHIIANAPFSPSPVTYRHLTKGLINSDRISEALDLLREMLNKGHGADSLVYNNLISGFLNLDNLDKANELFDELKERCLVYDGIVNATYMEWFFSKGRDKDAMDSYKSLMDRQFRMTPATCNVLLEVLLNHGKATQAWALFDQMLDNHTPPNFQAVNSDTFNIMVNECFKLGKFAEALATFRKAGTKQNSKPFAMDVAGYNNIIARFCENGMLSEAETLFEELCSKSLSPDVPTHRTLIDAYLKMKRIDDALRVFNRMVDTGLRVVASFGNKVFDELIKNGKAFDCAQILSKMGEKPDPKPDPTCYEVVIKGLCAEGLLDRSRDLLVEVMRSGVGVTTALREHVIEVFKNAGRDEEIERLLDMNRLGYGLLSSAPPRHAYYPPQMAAQQCPSSPHSQMTGAHSPPSGFPTQTAAWQHQPLPSAQMAVAHNLPSGLPPQVSGQQCSPLPSQMTGMRQPSWGVSPSMTGPPPKVSGQQCPPLPSQMTGMHQHSWGVSPPMGGSPLHASGQQLPPVPSQTIGMHTPSWGASPPMTGPRMPVSPPMGGSPLHASGQQLPPVPSQTTGMHTPSWGASPPMTGPRMPAAEHSPHTLGQPYPPTSGLPPHMKMVAPQMTAQQYTPSEPSSQMAGHQPYGTPRGPQQMAEQPYPPSRFDTSIGRTKSSDGNNYSNTRVVSSIIYGESANMSPPYHVASGPSQVTAEGPTSPIINNPPHSEESHQQQLEVPERIAA